MAIAVTDRAVADRGGPSAGKGGRRRGCASAFAAAATRGFYVPLASGRTSAPKGQICLRGGRRARIRRSKASSAGRPTLGTRPADGARFKFTNPKVKGTCGCGERAVLGSRVICWSCRARDAGAALACAARAPAASGFRADPAARPRRAAPPRSEMAELEARYGLSVRARCIRTSSPRRTGVRGASLPGRYSRRGRGARPDPVRRAGRC
jgi:hypothetical protein